MSYFGKVAKATLLLGAVGTLLALAAPVIAGWCGVSLASVGLSASPLWTGAYFGAFGGINAALSPIIDAIWPKSHHPHETGHEASPAVAYHLAHPGHVMSADMADLGQDTHFQDKVAASRPVEGSFQDKIAAVRTGASEHSV